MHASHERWQPHHLDALKNPQQTRLIANDVLPNLRTETATP